MSSGLVASSHDPSHFSQSHLLSSALSTRNTLSTTHVVHPSSPAMEPGSRDRPRGSSSSSRERGGLPPQSLPSIQNLFGIGRGDDLNRILAPPFLASHPALTPAHSRPSTPPTTSHSGQPENSAKPNSHGSQPFPTPQSAPPAESAPGMSRSVFADQDQPPSPDPSSYNYPYSAARASRTCTPDHPANSGSPQNPRNQYAHGPQYSDSSVSPSTGPPALAHSQHSHPSSAAPSPFPAGPSHPRNNQPGIMLPPLQYGVDPNGRAQYADVGPSAPPQTQPYPPQYAYPPQQPYPPQHPPPERGYYNQPQPGTYPLYEYDYPPPQQERAHPLQPPSQSSAYYPQGDPYAAAQYNYGYDPHAASASDPRAQPRAMMYPEAHPHAAQQFLPYQPGMGPTPSGSQYSFAVLRPSGPAGTFDHISQQLIPPRGPVPAPVSSVALGGVLGFGAAVNPRARPSGGGPSNARGRGSGGLLEAPLSPEEIARNAAARYQCPYCAKRFNRPSSLKIHVNTHTGEKPYACSHPGCGRRFSVMSNMRRHSRVHVQPRLREEQEHEEPDADQDAPTHDSSRRSSDGEGEDDSRDSQSSRSPSRDHSPAWNRGDTPLASGGRRSNGEQSSRPPSSRSNGHTPPAVERRHSTRARTRNRRPSSDGSVPGHSIGKRTRSSSPEPSKRRRVSDSDLRS